MGTKIERVTGGTVLTIDGGGFNGNGTRKKMRKMGTLEEKESRNGRKIECVEGMSG
jgi:hypothetical protein